MPPFNQMSGPPPGSTPQGLSSMLPQEPDQDDLGGANPEDQAGGGASGGLKDVFDELQSVLDALASILPDHAEEIDDVKSQLAEILAKAVSSGTPYRGKTGDRGLQTPSNPGFPV